MFHLTRRPYRIAALGLGVTIAMGCAVFINRPVAIGAEQAGTLSVNFLAGHVAQKRRDLPAAIRFLNRALQQDSQQPDVLRRTFLFSLMDGRIDEALALGERYLKNEPKAPVANLALAIRDARTDK